MERQVTGRTVQCLESQEGSPAWDRLTEILKRPDLVPVQPIDNSRCDSLLAHSINLRTAKAHEPADQLLHSGLGNFLRYVRPVYL
jgi:hypothetical protein